MSGEFFSALAQVIVVDVVLAGDNAIVIGTIAAALPPAERRKVVLLGILAALVMRIVFALAVVQLMAIPGLVFFGGLLLLGVAYKLWRDLAGADPHNDAAAKAAPTSFWRAAAAIGIADLGMSLDNVIGVAGAAREHPLALAIGLVLSIALMGAAATFIARLIGKHRWIAWGGLALIVVIAGRMIWEGAPALARLV